MYGNQPKPIAVILHLLRNGELFSALSKGDFISQNGLKGWIGF